MTLPDVYGGKPGEIHPKRDEVILVATKHFEEDQDTAVDRVLLFLDMEQARNLSLIETLAGAVGDYEGKFKRLRARAQDAEDEVKRLTGGDPGATLVWIAKERDRLAAEVVALKVAAEAPRVEHDCSKAGCRDCVAFTPSAKHSAKVEEIKATLRDRNCLTCAGYVKPRWDCGVCSGTGVVS